MIETDLIAVVQSGRESSWGNVFLTNSWTLYVDMTNEQHDMAMLRLGVDPQSVLISGHINRHGLIFRSSPGLDRREISEEESMKLMAAVREITEELK